MRGGGGKIIFSIFPARTAHRWLPPSTPNARPTSASITLLVTVIVITLLLVAIINETKSLTRSLFSLLRACFCFDPSSDCCQEAGCQEGRFVNGHQGQEACRQEGTSHCSLMFSQAPELRFVVTIVVALAIVTLSALRR